MASLLELAQKFGGQKSSAAPILPYMTSTTPIAARAPGATEEGVPPTIPPLAPAVAPTTSNLAELASKYGGVIKATAPAPAEEKGLLGRIGERVVERGKKFGETVFAQMKGERTLGETIVQAFGQTAGSAFDILGELLAIPLSNIAETIEKKPDIVPAIVRTIDEKKAEEIQKVFDTTTEKYRKWKETHPRQAENLEAVTNILTAVPVGALGRVTSRGVGIAAGKAAVPIERSAIRGLEADKQAFVRDLIRPVQTKAVKEAQVARTTETGVGPFKRSIIAPSSAEARAEAEVMKIPEIRRGITKQQAYNIIDDYLSKEAAALSSALEKPPNRFIFSHKELLSRLEATKAEIAKSPLIVGDSEKIADKLIAKVNEMIKAKPATAPDLLQVRKDFDRWVQSQKPKAFDAAAENAFTITNREIRRAINTFLDEKAPNAAVKESLRKQSALFEALDNIKPKAALEPDTAFWRMLQAVGDVVGTRSRMIQILGAFTGFSILGASTVYAAPFAILGIGGYFVYRAGKIVMNPRLRLALAKTLRLINRIAAQEALTPEARAAVNRAKAEVKAFMDKHGGAGLSIKEVPGKPPILPGKKAEGAIPKTTASLPVYQGEKVLTTKILQKLEGRSSVSKQFIEDLTNSGDIRQVERDLIRNILKDYQGDVPVKEFANKVRTELLPLSATYGPLRYEGVSLPDAVKGPVVNYQERIYQSPIRTSVGEKHFGPHFADMPGENVAPRNYFAHTRIEDLPNLKPPSGIVGIGPKASGDTRRVIELQSDLFQKGGLEKEFDYALTKNMPKDLKDRVLKEHLSDSQIAQEMRARGIMPSTEFDRLKLEPYRNTWHERIIREEVKQAAKDGKTKLQFPTGETAMKIEGLAGDSTIWWRDTPALNRKLKAEDLKPGVKIVREQGADIQQWVVTEVDDELRGSFKATPLQTVERRMKNDKQSLDEVIKTLERSEQESFLIEGAINTSNPIYRFYEKEVGRFLKNKYDAKLVADPQGVKWWEVDITKSMAKDPVLAYGFSKLGTAIGVGVGIAAGAALPFVLPGGNQQENLYKNAKNAINSAQTSEQVEITERYLDKIHDFDRQAELRNLASERIRELTRKEADARFRPVLPSQTR